MDWQTLQAQVIGYHTGNLGPVEVGIPTESYVKDSAMAVGTGPQTGQVSLSLLGFAILGLMVFYTVTHGRQF